MNFQDNLSAMPDISHLSGLDVLDAQGKVLHHIPAVQGKLGSLKLYNALTQEFDNRLDPAPVPVCRTYRRCAGQSGQTSKH